MKKSLEDMTMGEIVDRMTTLAEEIDRGLKAQDTAIEVVAEAVVDLRHEVEELSPVVRPGETLNGKDKLL